LFNGPDFFHFFHLAFDELEDLVKNVAQILGYRLISRLERFATEKPKFRHQPQSPFNDRVDRAVYLLIGVGVSDPGASTFF
jgi:hypothetical protein